MMSTAVVRRYLGKIAMLLKRTGPRVQVPSPYSVQERKSHSSINPSLCDTGLRATSVHADEHGGGGGVELVRESRGEVAMAVPVGEDKGSSRRTTG